MRLIQTQGLRIGAHIAHGEGTGREFVKPHAFDRDQIDPAHPRHLCDLNRRQTLKFTRRAQAITEGGGQIKVSHCETGAEGRSGGIKGSIIARHRSGLTTRQATEPR